MGGGQYKDDCLPQYSFVVKKYLVKANPRRPPPLSQLGQGLPLLEIG